MIESSGLKISGWQWSRRFNNPRCDEPLIWYLFIMRDDSKLQMRTQGNDSEKIDLIAGQTYERWESRLS